MTVLPHRGYASNMRSESDRGQECLQLEVERAGRPVKPRRGPQAAPRRLRSHHLLDDSLAARGWPRGTEVLVDPARRVVRGEVVLADDGGRLRVGELALELGRPSLRTDVGVVWLGSSVRYLGVVVAAEPPLAGMPDLPGA